MKMKALAELRSKWASAGHLSLHCTIFGSFTELHLYSCIKHAVMHLYSCMEAVSFMVGCSGENAECPVNLLREDHSHKLVRKCESRKAELQICSPQHIL